MLRRAFAMLVFLALSGCGDGDGAGSGGGDPPNCSAPEGSLPALALSQVAGGLEQPVGVVSPPRDQRLFVVEQDGRIRLIEGETASVFLDIRDRVQCCGEMGLLGLAFHPEFASNGRYFVYFTQLDNRQAVYEFPSDKLLLAMDDRFGNHNGGALAFGRDGMLYVATGDGGGGGDPDETGQDPNSLLGKILRLDVDGGDPYAPAGNYPGGAPEVWDIGLRNPWRISFDACTGDLYIGDVGQETYEEIDVEPAGQGGKNYGWDLNEGLHCYYDSGDPMPCPMTFSGPVVEYDHGSGQSITGGYVYRGSSIPALRGRYLYGDYGSNRIWSFVWSDGQANDPLELSEDLMSTSTVQGLSSFGQDGAGEVYLVSHQTGHLYKIVAE